MSLEILVNVKKCGTDGCNNMVPVGRLRPEIPRKCTQCKNKIRNEKHKMIKKLRRLKNKKCHTCGGGIKIWNAVFCSDYCKWLNYIKNTSHKKAIISVHQVVD